MHTFGYLIVGLLLVACTIQHVSSRRPLELKYIQKFDESDAAYRLPNNTKPEAYDITLKTYEIDENDAFEGTVKIQIVAVEATNFITIHARQINIKDAKLRSITDNSDIELDTHTSDSITEFFNFPTKTQLEKDKKYELTIWYVGKLRTDRGGFYKASYLDKLNRRRWLAVTQFESTNARHAFPCYDEPGLKAKFTIRINHASKYNAISNMPVKTSSNDGDNIITEFEETPLMSTYLVAFIVSDFKYIEEVAGENNPTLQRVYTSENKINQAEYALKEGVDILNAIAKYLDVPFTIKKMDQVAIPAADFTAGAMENWGLVTYRDPYLLYDKNVHLSSRQLDISTVIAHEYGHQWFGNLVSPKWWTYIWLNEGFATLFEYLGTGLVHADWNIFNYFVINKLQPVLRYDAKTTTRAMNTYVESPNAIGSLFDNIAYAKSGSVIRMFWHALGDSSFKKGLKYYLSENQLNVADEDKLFASLDKAAKEDKTLDSSMNVKDLFGSWSNQKGFPLLKVSRNYGDNTVKLEQEKFDEIYNSEAKADPSVWSIPYNFASKNNPNFDETKPSGWLNEKEKTLQQSDSDKWSNDEWLLFNRQQTGFYRVLYDEKNYNLINNELISGDHSKIHQINRAQYIDDLSAFANNGRLSPKFLIKALHYLTKEKDFAPWVAARRAILEYNQILIASEKYAKFKEIIVKIVELLYDEKKLEATDGEGFFEKYTRNIAISLACQFGSSKCLKETYTKWLEFVENPFDAVQDVRAVILANGIRSANRTQINSLYSFSLYSTDEDVRKEIFSSLANIQNETYIDYFLNKVIDHTETLEKTTKSERLAIVQSILGGNGLLNTIHLLTSEFDKVISSVGSVPTILASIAGKITTTESQIEFNNLLDVAKAKGVCTDSEIETFKKTVTDKLEWMKTYLEPYENGLLDDAVTEPPSTSYVLIVVLVLLIGGIILIGGFCFIRWKRNKQANETNETN